MCMYIGYGRWRFSIVKLLKCGSKPDATCSDFEAPNPCNPTTTSAGTTATTTATTRGLPTTTTTTATTTDVMLWITKFHGVSQCLTWHNKKVIGAPCEAYQPAQLWEYTKKGEIVLHMNQLCLTGTSLYVSLTECDGSELQNFTAKTDDWTNIILMSQSKCLYFRMDMGKRIFLGPWDPSKKPVWKSLPYGQRPDL